MSKRVKTDYGSMDVHTPRDCEGSFDIKVLPEGLEHKIICLYALGMSYSDWSSELYRTATKNNVAATNLSIFRNFCFNILKTNQ